MNPQSFPEQGLADIRKAIELGPLTAPLLHNAARLCAIGSKNDPTLVSEALDHLEQGIDLGFPPNKLAADFLFHDFTTMPRFQALVNKPSFLDRLQNPVRLVDPIQEWHDAAIADHG